MCGRFTLFEPNETLAGIFGVSAVHFPGPRYNIAPSQPVAVVRTSSGSERCRELVMLRWGLVPSWARDPSIGDRLINARAETVPEKPAFRGAWKSRRCLIPANGFYEWQRRNGKKKPWYIRMRDRNIFAMAGLWERRGEQPGETLESCTLITTESNDLLAPIHGRMPVILAPSDFDRWLFSPAEEASRLRALLRPYPAEEMEAFEIGLRVNNPGNDGPDLIEPVV